MCRSGSANKTAFLRNKLTRTGALFSLVKHGVGTELSVNRQRVLYRQSFAMESDRSLREKSRLRRKGWSHWVRAMVPDFSPAGRQWYEKRDTEGYMCRYIREAFPEYARYCGIYEWRAKGAFRDQPNFVVYIGSTCRDKPGALRARILEYCNNGSHKAVQIDDALRRGYELWVRVKRAGGSRKSAEDQENELLDRYDYAWNIRLNNGLHTTVTVNDEGGEVRPVSHCALNSYLTVRNFMLTSISCNEVSYSYTSHSFIVLAVLQLFISQRILAAWD